MAQHQRAVHVVWVFQGIWSIGSSALKDKHKNITMVTSNQRSVGRKQARAHSSRPPIKPYKSRECRPRIVRKRRKSTANVCVCVSVFADSIIHVCNRCTYLYAVSCLVNVVVLYVPCLLNDRNSSLLVLFCCCCCCCRCCYALRAARSVSCLLKCCSRQFDWASRGVNAKQPTKTTTWNTREKSPHCVYAAQYSKIKAVEKKTYERTSELLKHFDPCVLYIFTALVRSLFVSCICVSISFSRSVVVAVFFYWYSLNNCHI